MHGILACSALHLAYLNASERQGYLMTAAMHQELAIPLFRKAVSSTNAENCHAILAFVHIIAICSFALTKIMSGSSLWILMAQMWFLGGCTFCEVGVIIYIQ